MKLTTGWGKLFFPPSVERLNILYAYRSNVTIAPGVTPTTKAGHVNINDFHVTHAHAHGRYSRGIITWMQGMFTGQEDPDVISVEDIQLSS